MFKRIKKLWKLSKIHDFDENGVLKVYADDVENGIIRPLVTRRSLLPENIDEILGDGKAGFISSGTEEEYIDFKREEEGTKGWYERLKNL